MTDVTRQERVLYGDLAPAVRKLGDAVSKAEQVVEDTAALLQQAREGDELAMGKTNKPEEFVDGESPYTLWLASVYGRIWELRKQAGRVFQEVAAESLAHEIAMRQVVDSYPVDGSGDMTTVETTSTMGSISTAARAGGGILVQ